MDHLQTMVEIVDREKVELLNQLEEEKRKVEDLRSGLRKNQLLKEILR